jgi:hypothetical protein
MWKICWNRSRQTTVDNIIRHLRIACWITKAADKHSECVKFIAFPWQQWLRELALVLLLYVHPLSYYALTSTIMGALILLKKCLY